jgi:hypothetical protein
MVTIAYSGSGVPLWTNRYNGRANGDNQARAVAVDTSGNVFVTGWSYDSSSSDDYATIKYSSAGVPLWTNRYNGAANSSDQAAAMALDSSGNVFVTGSSYSGTVFGFDFATIAYSGAGIPLWTNRYAAPSDSHATGIAVDGSGNVLVTGSSAAVGGADYATIKYSGAGIPLWTNRYNGPGNGDDVPAAVAVDSSGNVFVTGYSFNSAGNYDYATVAYSSAGVPLVDQPLQWAGKRPGPGDCFGGGRGR